MSDVLRLADAVKLVAKWSDSEHWDTLEEAAAELRRLHAENEALKAELIEQARINGMGGEREARLMALNAELASALRVAVKLNGFREFNDHIPAMKAALAKLEESRHE